jgi:hypothetical protein
MTASFPSLVALQRLGKSSCSIDTYIDGLQGRALDAVADVLGITLSNHSTVAIQELMHTLGVPDPKHTGAKAADRGLKLGCPRHTAPP